MMTMTRYRHTRTLLLLLLLMTGVSGAWGQVTTNTYYLDPGSSVGAIGGNWASDNAARYAVSTAGGYTSIAVGTETNGGNGTRVYTNSTNNLVGAGVSFILQFDIKITGGSNQASWFQVNDFTNTAVNTGGSAASTTASSILQLAQTSAGGTEWSINGDAGKTVTLATDHWYRFKLLRTYDKTYLTVVDRGTGNTSDVNSSFFAEQEITTNSTVGGLGRLEFATKRYNSALAIDNLGVQKWGWDVSSHSVSLTAANNDNKITSGMPVLYNPGGASTPAYTYDGTVLGTLDATYPPRLKTTGTGTVLATIGDKKTQYSLTVTSPRGGGSYNAATQTYTFDTEGIVTDRSIDDVPFINMSYRGGPTAVVVNDGTRTVLKVIDANGYSHPNLNNGASKIPPETNWGGTFYKFVPSVNGTLTVTGNMDYAVIYASDDTSTQVASSTSGTSISDVSLVAGKTYYLYNAGSDSHGSNTPLLHSFTFVPSSTSLTFRNPQSVITIDVSETSYTNPAISAAGLPITYSIMSGSGIADVNVDGKVTFKGDYFLSPEPVTVRATDGTNNITYTINLVKRTWIFNEASKWKTTVSKLTGGGWDTNGGSGYTYTDNGLNGDKFVRNTAAIGYAQLTTNNGTAVMPETAGLLINKVSNNDRLYIAPADDAFTHKFLAMRASSISIDDVQEGQTVTVNWTGGNGSAVLDMSDAAGTNVTGSRGGTLQLTATQTGRVEIYSNPIVAYINSITISTPTRAIGTLTYAKTVLSTGGGAESRTGYTITDETGAVNLRDAYSGPGNFKSSNTSVVTVDASGNITPIATGTAIITATATAKNSVTHQATVTLVALVEVVSDASTRIRTIRISDLLYDIGASGVNANNGLDRRIPGFDLTFTGGDGAKVNDPSVLILRNSGGNGKLTITPRLSGSETVTITQALVTVKTADSSPTWSINGGTATAVAAGGVSLTSLTGNSLSIEFASGGYIEITGIRLYYTCSVPAKADECLDETKVAPTIKFDNTHLMRIPGDGKAFTQTPTRVTASPDWFKSFLMNCTYVSSATNIATINSDGTNGQLLQTGESTITATFNETTYFASATASYTVDNVLSPSETYTDIAMVLNQKVHIEASAYENNTNLSLSGTANPHATTLAFDTERGRKNTYAEAAGNLTLTNSTTVPIVIYSLHVVTSNLRCWLFYQGQEDNYQEQVVFTGLTSGNIAGFRVVDVGDPENPIDLTDSYELKGAYSFGTPGAFSASETSYGAVTGNTSSGSSTLSHPLKKKAGMADGYPDGETAGQEVTATTTIQVLPFDDDNPYTWDFMSVDNGSDVLGRGWTYDEREFQYGYFSEYTPIFNNDDATIKTNKHGIVLKDEFRWYHDRGLRANLSQPKASIKFPVKAGMEIDIYAASSSADISHGISNVTDILGNDTEVMYIAEEGEANPVHSYFLAKADGMVEIKATDKVGLYLHSITLRLPEIHFQDEIVTQLPTGDDGANYITNPTINIPEDKLTYLSYEITASSEKTFGGDDLTSGTLASIDNDSESVNKGRLTLTGTEGVFEVTVTNTNPERSALEPKSGTYKVYVVNFRFDTDRDAAGDQQTATLNLDNNEGEDYFGGDDVSTAHYPLGKDNVVTPINYSFEIAAGNSARAMLKQTTNTVPGLTTYQLTAYSPGEIILRATTGRITAECTLTVEGYAFQYVAPVLSDNDIAEDSYVFLNKLPDDFNFSNTTLQADLSGDWTAHPTYEVVTIDEKNYVQISNLKGKGHGAIRYTATDNNGTVGDTSDDKVIQFVLTLAYPASSNKRWDFYRSTVGLKGQIAHDNKIGDYSSASVADYVIDGPYPQTDYWHTNTSWSRVYRNGTREPRWALDRSVRRDNAFIIEETAGLQIETPTNSFYVDNNSTAAYTHIGIHSRSTITIPKLKNGDFVSLNLSRVVPNNGAIIEATNVTDLAGKAVTEQFTITRSQTDYREDGELAHDGSGARIIPGYYTFIAHKAGADETEEFDVSFTLADEGFLDVLGIEIYAPGSRTDSGSSDPENGYDYTMRSVKLSNTGYPEAPATLLKEEGQQRVYNLSYCHPLWSTSVGPAEYVVRDQTDNLNVDFENVSWISDGGATYNDGRITVNNGYGRIKVRMNNYTAEGKYLIGYTPDYSLTVGHPPHQDYPYTWNFENISGGAVKNRGNNVYNSVSSDPYTWTGMGYETYQLDTRTSGGSLYVPGGTLVSAARDLGAKGTISELNAANLGCDEFNGLGFNGQITFKLAQLGDEANDAPTGEWSRGSVNDELLHYTITSSNLNDAAGTGGYWTAADGKIKFGQTRKRVTSDVSATGAAYQMDGGNSKNLLLKPQRPLKDGDQIYLRGYTASTVNVLRSGFSFYAGANDNAYDALKTLHWDSSVADTEHTITYTVSQGDGLAGRDSVYLFRADKQYTVFLIEVRITGDDSAAPTAYERAITCNGDVTVTIPDLVLDHYVYIKSSAEPKTVPSSLTKILSTDDGTDGYDVATDVYKYKVIAAGNADVVFDNGTKIYRIGVTNIMKPMKRVGSGDAWATESRDHAIDYKQTGVFTVNDITANTVTATRYALQRVTVRMNEQTDAMPAETGMVLKLPLVGADDAATDANVTNFGKAKGGNSVPLFYPPYSTPILSSSVVGFGGTQGNLMMANLDKRELQYERETGVIDKDGDNVDDSGAADGDYTRFIFTERYMKWTKIDNNAAVPTDFEDSGNVPVFVRMHLYADADTYKDGKTVTQLNTLGANKAYMLIRSGNVPKALWDTSGGAKGYIGIEGISDWYEDDGIDDNTDKQHNPYHDGRTYNLKGQVVNGDGALPPGIYIKNGRKFVVK